MTDLLTKWLSHFDPIHRGWTPRGIANGLCATRGFAFPRIAGGYNLYRSMPDSLDIEFSAPVGAAGANAKEIETFSWQPATGPASYVYAVRSIGGGGVESDAGGVSRSVDVDEAHLPDALRPNGAGGLMISVVSAGRFELSWGYLSRRQESPPIRFDVFEDGGSGSVDFESPIGSVLFEAHRSTFQFITVPYSQGLVRRFGVRAVAESGATDGSIETVSAMADAQAPSTHPDVLVEIVESD